MAETWYEVGFRMRPVKVVKSTDKSVWVEYDDWFGTTKVSRQAIHSSCQSYYRTAEEAIAARRKQWQDKCESAERSLQRARVEAALFEEKVQAGTVFDGE